MRKLRKEVDKAKRGSSMYNLCNVVKPGETLELVSVDLPAATAQVHYKVQTRDPAELGLNLSLLVCYIFSKFRSIAELALENRGKSGSLLQTSSRNLKVGLFNVGHSCSYQHGCLTPNKIVCKEV